MKKLKITKDNINELKKLPDDLTNLDCYGLYLKKLPKLPNSLEILQCSTCILEELPDLPDSIKYIDCTVNNLKKLPKLSEKLEDLWCGLNELKELPELPNSLKYLNCYNNPFVCPIDKDIIEKFDMKVKYLYKDEKIKEYQTLEYQKFLLDTYPNKFKDIEYNFKELGIKFHKELKDHWALLSNYFNLI